MGQHPSARAHNARIPQPGARKRSLGMQARASYPRLDPPAFEVINTADALQAAIETLTHASARALGVAVLLAVDPGRPRSVQGDPRRAAMTHVAIAPPEGPVRIIDASAIRELTPLQALFGGAATESSAASAPYVVLHNAHLGLTALGRRGLRPGRFGCTRIAATLLAEGADGRRSERPLGELVEAELERSLPGAYARGLAEAELGAPLTMIAASVASTLVPLMRRLTPRLRERGLSRVYELECQVLRPVIDMEAAGMPVDQAQFQRVAQGWARERHALLRASAERPVELT
ncbi:MAG: hypothetical protein KC468_33995, partial [Myxococcales bacterium]|nr:hypothetical protein [Myxococcales bacterium]